MMKPLNPYEHRHSPFLDMVDRDREMVFMNLDEFAERHNVENMRITCVLDEDTLQKRKDNTLNEDVAQSNYLLFAKTEDLPRRMPAGQTLNVDGRQYIITDWKEDMGIAEITLAANLSM